MIYRSCEQFSWAPGHTQHSEIRRLGRAVYPRSRFAAALH